MTSHISHDEVSHHFTPQQHAKVHMLTRYYSSLSSLRSCSPIAKGLTMALSP